MMSGTTSVTTRSQTERPYDDFSGPLAADARVRDDW